MYRELAPQGLALGQTSGPYTGQPRRFAHGELPADVLARLEQSLSGKAVPEPLLRKPGRSFSARSALLLAFGLLGAGALLALCARRLGQLGGGQPETLLPAYAAAGGVVALAFGLRRRHRLRPGTYLFPLDVVEVSHDHVTVTPLGSLRSAAVEQAGPGLCLSLSLADGSKHLFPVSNAEQAERAFKRVEHAQGTLDQLTESPDLERSADADVFFALRSGGQRLDQFPEATASEKLARTGRWALVAAAGATLGMGAWGARNLVSDQLAFRRALEQDTPQAYQTYLDADGYRRDEARAALARLEQRAALAALRKSVEEEGRNKGEPWEEYCLPTVSAVVSPEEAMACYGRRARPDRPEIAAAIAGMIRRDRPLRVGFVRQADETPGAARRKAQALRAEQDAADEALVVAALRRAFGEVVPARLLPVEQVAAGAPGSPPELVVSYRVKEAGEHDVTYVFDVRFAAVTSGKHVAFELTMPPPKAPLSSVRDRSLFAIDPGAPASVATQATSARAFDRLYDELYGIFFEGDPRVPLADAKGLRHARAEAAPEPEGSRRER